MEAYITDLAVFLPNAPVSNEQMEQILGMVNQLPSRTRAMILRNNKIRTRYYAIDPATGRTTHSNAQLAAEAVRGLHPYDGFSLEEIEVLACGTTQADQLIPGHASMVHGELKSPPCDIISTAGVCISGMTALKYAAMNVALGQSRNAVATGSEQASSFMRSRMAGTIPAEVAEAVEQQPALAFNADLLRWMLSDGAGAAFIAPQPTPGKRAFKIEWIDIFSFANELDTCMYAGAVKNPDGSITGWREFDKPQEMLESHALLVKQDVKLLEREIVATTANRTIPLLSAKRGIKAEEVDIFVAHYSSDYFRLPIYQGLKDVGFHIPLERWYTNLPDKGNTGSASVYIILEELLHSDRIKPGDKVLCYVPESGRFSMCYALLTVV
ncbi:beta-ketoacyl-ACP synthase III [Desulfuromonas carbonis]|uniref:beta-ketoacyl-ACP synthase III n=1 Tax=Desulfuromonas sp. DDH964 TaxID=1823759 RepID=UPI00078C8CCD|nr:beta-ketoacyl-ACP synthase III [Desulfuromonas sp. DDH964]AMV72144.1 3-oxoacyl-ACP synthase [Desulfuromonas sp. DDH964]